MMKTFTCFFSILSVFFFTLLIYAEEKPEFSSGLSSAISLVRADDYESSVEIFTKLEEELPHQENPSLAADYWFYRAICEHQLLQKEACKKSLDQLETLNGINGFTLPVRFTALSRLMRKDLETLQDESLEMISRKMKNVERSLNSGNGDENVQKSEEEIVKMLDAMIQEREQKTQMVNQKTANKKQKPGKPMEKAEIGSGKGAGKVTRRDLDYSQTWGQLPEKEREEVLQQLGRDFPPHYREAIEQYFKKIAE